jgi:hypothetical protein
MEDIRNPFLREQVERNLPGFVGALPAEAPQPAARSGIARQGPSRNQQPEMIGRLAREEVGSKIPSGGFIEPI